MKKLIVPLVAFGLLATILPLGTAQQADVPGKDFPDIPRYNSGAARVAYYEYYPFHPYASAQAAHFFYWGQDNGSMIMEFYKTKMPENGWVLVDENLSTPGLENVAWLWEAEYEKTDARAFLSVVEQPIEDRIEIYIFRAPAAIENIPVGENRMVIEITTNVTISRGVVRVKTITPQEAPAPLENTLCYIDLTTDIAENIDKATIGFRVPKRWISENNIDPATVGLWRYAGNRWNELPTQAAGEKENFYMYSAETTGFSIFAITGSRAAERLPQNGLPLVWVGVGSALLIVVIILVLGYRKRSQSR